MEANKIRLTEFLGSSKRTFNIPVYQRNYDWKTEHCTRLFKDIEKIALSNFEIEHFLGTVVYVISKSRINWTEFVLIDGQQRITSISLFLLALYNTIEDPMTKEEIFETYLTNKHVPDSKFRVKLKPIESDMGTYESILDKKNEQTPTSNIYRNYNLFMALIAGSSVPPERLYEALNNVELVYIQLDKDKKSENPQMIFESLNSTGLSLTQADLIRNFLLMNHDYDKQVLLYKNYWMKIEKRLGNSKISDFIKDYLTMKISKTTPAEKIYESFKEFVVNPENNYDEEGILEDLLILSEYYAQMLFCTSKNEAINDCLLQFQQLKQTTVYPVLLQLFDDCYQYHALAESELVESMQVLIVYIFRRAICGYQTNWLNKVFSNLIQESEKLSGASYPDRLLTVLTQKTGGASFPRDKEFAKDFAQIDFYHNRVAKYALAMLANSPTKEKISMVSDITIEHIMPQTLTPQWRIDLGAKYEEIHAQYLHTVGNLTLSGYNPELSNKSFPEKKHIYKNSNINICSHICDYDTWEEKDILHRAQFLTHKALSIWALPTKYNKVQNATAIDYATEYNIQADINVTGEKPHKLIIMNAKYQVKSWNSLLEVLCSELFDLDNTLFYNLLLHVDFSGKRRILKDVPDGMQKPYKIANGLYIETGLSASNIVNYAKIICDHFSMAEDVYFTLNKKTANNI